MNRTNQSTVIKAAINSCLEKGLKDKQDIYSTVVTELGVPRPTVRRVAKDLREELLAKIQILQSETKSVSEVELLNLSNFASLLLLAETSLSRVNMASRVEKLKTAEYAYIKVLSIEPNHIQATKGIRTIKRMRRTDLLFALLGFSLVVGVAISLF